MRQLILYGRGLIAEEYSRYLKERGRGGEIACFAVTKLAGQGGAYCGYPCLEIREAVAAFPEAEVHLALQEKYHGEVIGLLKELGRVPSGIIGLHRMTQLWGELGILELEGLGIQIKVQKDRWDYSMLRLENTNNIRNRFTLYPLTQVPLSVDDNKNLQKYVRGNFYDEWREPEAVRVGKSLEVQDLYIAMAVSEKDARVGWGSLPAYMHPVLGGATDSTGKRTPCMGYDDAGHNISRYNSIYSELTVAYHLWMNPPEARYLGLCHYRRHFVLTEKVETALVAGTVDVLLTTPRLTFPSVREYFAGLPVTTMDEQDFENMLAFLKREDLDMWEYTTELFQGQVHFPNNMVIARREIYLDYCRLMFAVLRGMQRHYEEKGISRPARYLGYVGELLTTAYFTYHRRKWRTGFVDYKLLQEI